MNPYLPGWEYIPDGEPRVFGDRVYVYGSHDRFNAPIFCVNDYICWSAPVDDLSDWRYEGMIYRKKQDPRNPLGLRLLFAPDVVQGRDGRFYLYYAFDFMGIMGVAASDTPAGQYEFLGHVRHKDGTVWGRRKGDQFPFDPGVLLDGVGRYDDPETRKTFREHPYFTQEEKDGNAGFQYIANLRDGSTAGFKYFDCQGVQRVTVMLRGTASGCFQMSLRPDFSEVAAEFAVALDRSTKRLEALCCIPDGVHVLYFCFRGTGAVDFLEFELK